MASYINEYGKLILTGDDAIKGWIHCMSRLRENRKLHYKTTFQDLPISVENRRGSIRRGTDSDGEEWETKMKVPYGYIQGTEGVDGDALDTFVGPEENAAYAYVVHCNTPDGGKFDEDKVMLGFSSEEQAKRCFIQHYDDPNFFGGIDAIPMWKFKQRVWVKKHTTKKLVASRAGLQVPEGMLEKIEAFGQGGRDTDQIMKKSILGHHRDIMMDPEVREGGPGSGPHKDEDESDEDRDKRLGGTQDPRKIGSPASKDPQMWKKGNKVKDESGRKGTVLYQTPIGSMIQWEDGEKEHIKSTVGGRRDVAREHGVQGQKWGVVNPRSDTGKPRPKPDLQNDPRTMNMMQVIKRSQPQLNAIRVWQKNRAARLAAQQQSQTPQQKKQEQNKNHEEALSKLKELGWKIAEIGARLTGTEAALGIVKSIVHSSDGKKAVVTTDKAGNHKIQPQRTSARKSGSSPKGWGSVSNRTVGSRRESKRTFESRVGSFLREAKKQKTYYARSLSRYGSEAEESDIEMIKESFGGGVNSPKTKRHAELGMGYFHKKVDAAKRVVVKPISKRRITAGVFSEAKHAIKNRIPVYAIYKGKMRRVKNVEALGNANNRGHFGKLIFKKRKKK